MDYAKKLGNNIRKYRKIKEISVKELAEKSNLSESTINKMENGEIKQGNIENIIKIADILEVQIDSLAYDSLIKFNKKENDLKNEIKAELDLLDDKQLSVCYEIIKILLNT